MSKIIYTRSCPLCCETIEYKYKQTFNNATENNAICRSCAAKKRCELPGEIERRKSIMLGKYKGELNPFWGKKHSDETKQKIRKQSIKDWEKSPLRTETRNIYQIWCDKYGIEEADKRQKSYCEKQSKLNSGINNNMYGKPSPQGSGNGWSGWYKEWFFRSLRELSYVLTMETNGDKWISAEGQEFRITYQDWENKTRSYFPDFLVNDSLIVEVKPTNLHNTPLIVAKKKAAEIFCKNRGLQYLLTDCKILQEKEVLNLYLQKIIKFTDRYEEKFKERYL